MNTSVAETWCGLCNWAGTRGELEFKANPELRMFGLIPGPRVGHCPECGKLAVCAPPPDTDRTELVA